MSQQVSIEHIANLEQKLKDNYNILNEQLSQYTICRLPSSIIQLPPVAIFLALAGLFSFLFIYSFGLGWWLKGFGLIIPIFLAWSQLYEIQPSGMEEQLEQQSMNDGPSDPSQDTNTQQLNPLHEVAQPNDPVYLFWSKYFLLYSLSIIVDKFFRSIIFFSSDEWMTSYSFFFNLHMFLVVLPPWYYAQFLYSFILEPILLNHHETIIHGYEFSRTTFSTIAKDTLTTTTTAFKSVGKHALVGGISSLSQNQSTR